MVLPPSPPPPASGATRLRVALALALALAAASVARAAGPPARQAPAPDPRQEALTAFQREELERAAELAASWVAEHPGDAAMQFLLGMSRVSLGQRMENEGRPHAEVLAVYRSALEPLLEAERRAPEGALEGVDHAVAHILLVEGRPWEALDRVERAIEKHPQHPILPRLRGTCYLRLGRFERAAEDLAEAVRRTPRDLSARLLYARALFQAGRDEDARQTLGDYYRSIGGEGPDERHWKVQMEINALSGNELEVSRAALEEARRVDPERGEGRARLGILYYRLGERAAARAELEAALASGDLEASLRAEVLHHRGLLASHAGEHEAARRLFARALELAPSSAQILKNQAATLRRLGDPGADRLLERFREVVALENETRRLRDSLLVMPESRRTHVDLVHRLIDLGQLEEAGDWLDTLRGRFPGDPAIPELEARLERGG